MLEMSELYSNQGRAVSDIENLVLLAYTESTAAVSFFTMLYTVNVDVRLFPTFGLSLEISKH